MAVINSVIDFLPLGNICITRYVTFLKDNFILLCILEKQQPSYTISRLQKYFCCHNVG